MPAKNPARPARRRPDSSFSERREARRSPWRRGGAGLDLVALVALALGLRLLGLGEPGLWLDEAMSAHFVGLAPAALVEALRLDSGPPLYYLLLQVWTSFFGLSEVALRAFSALCGVALVAALYGVGRQLFDRRTGRIAAALAALLPIQVAYSQEARGYAALSLFALLAMAVYQRWLEEGGRGALVASLVATSAVLYLHHYGFFILGAQGLVGLAAGRRRWPAVGVAAVPLLAYLPWVGVLRDQMAITAPTAWMGAVWEANGFFGSLWASLHALAPGGGQAPYTGLAAVKGTVAPGLAVAVGVSSLGLGVFFLIRSIRGAGTREESAGRARWLLLYLFAPLLAAALYSAVASPIYLPGRVEQSVLPAFCLVVAVGLARLRSSALSRLLLVAWMGLSILTLWQRHGTAPALEGGGGRALAAQLGEGLEAGDRVVATSLTRPLLDYYLRGRPAGVEIVSFPAEMAAHPGNEDLAAQLAEPDLLRRDADRILTSARGRLLIAAVGNPATGVLVDRLRADPRLLRARVRGTFTLRRLGLEVTLIEATLRP